MAFVNPSFSVRRGDDRLVEIDVEEADGTDSDLSNAKIRLTYAKSAGGRALVTKTEADLTVSGNRITDRLTLADTMALEAFRTYWIQCRVTFPDGSQDGFRETVTTGSFTVDPTQ